MWALLQAERRETVYFNLKAWAVLFSLSGSVMGRETVYLSYDFSEVPQADEYECKRIQEEVHFKRLAKAWKKYPRCQPQDFHYQLCAPR